MTDRKNLFLTIGLHKNCTKIFMMCIGFIAKQIIIEIPHELYVPYYTFRSPGYFDIKP